MLAAIAGVALVAALAPPPPPTPAPAADDGVTIAPVDATATSWFCSAGAPGTYGSTVYLTNSASTPVRGTMTTVAPAGSSGSPPTTQRTVTVPALGTAAVDPGTGLPAGPTASSFAFGGGGVAVDQVASGPTGWSTAPCASSVQGQWNFAGGATVSGDTLTLLLYDPAAAQAVVNVSFLTDGGMITPQAYQGLTVPPGQLVVENVGDFVQNQSNIATLITTESGALVADELQQWSSASAGGLSLRLGSPNLSTTWYFGQTTAAAGSKVSFTLANPANAAVSAKFTLGLSTASANPVSVNVPPESTAALDASTAAGWPTRIPYSVRVDASAPIVVGRSVVGAQSGTAPLVGASSGTVTATTSWLVTGPGVPNAPGVTGAALRTLAVANPGPSAASVTVTVLGRSRPLATMSVAPGSLLVLGPRVAAVDSGLGAFLVRADRPVVVETDNGPSGGPGIVSSAGFPVPGG